MNANKASRSHSGLEVTLSSGPEQISPSNIHLEDKYYNNSSISEPEVVGASQTKQSNPTQQRRLFRPLTFWIIAILIVVCLGAALGGGLGGGLAAQRKPTSTATAHSTTASSLTATSAPAITLACPSANGTTYTATNKPQPTLSPQLQRSNETLEYDILCDTNEQSFVLDLQNLSNVTSLRECIDACALFTFQLPGAAGACTAVVWTNGRDGQLNPATNERILKANVTLSSKNESSNSPGYDGAVLLYT